MIVSYLKYQEEYSQKYGDRSIVLMQVGNFYEMYEYNPEKDETPQPWPNKRIGHCIEIGNILNMVVTRKDKKKPYSLTNVDMVGFPLVAYPKHRDVLLFNNFTIIKIDQKKDDAGSVERYVSEILSPATQFENISQIPIANNIVSIYVEVMKESFSYEDYVITVGLSCIDVTIGENRVLEIYSKENNNIFPIQEIYRFLSSTQPREILFHLNYKTKDPNKVLEYEKFLKTNLSLTNNIITDISPEFFKLEYCTRFLSKVFSTSKNMILTNIIETLGLERIYYGMISYILLLQFCYEHNTVLIEKLAYPNTSYLDANKYLILTHNAINQLDILPSKNSTKHNRSNKTIDSLFSVINFTKTALGKRFLLNRLANPITDVHTLNRSYNMIQTLMSSDSLLTSLSAQLKDIPDLERYQRKLYLRLIKPNEFAVLFKSYLSVIKIYSEISETSLDYLLFDPTEFNECLSIVFSKFDLDVLALAKIEGEKITIEEEKPLILDESTQWNLVSQVKKRIDSIMDELNSHLESTKGKKIESFDKYGFTTTAHKAKVLSGSKINTHLCGDLRTVNANKDVIITSDLIAKLCSEYFELQDQLAKYIYSEYMTVLSTISKFKFFSKVDDFISQLDFICSGAKSALQNKYYKPEIIEKKDAYCTILEMRHPIVEAIISGEYVFNDISLENQKGMLLYGMNSCGKSTLAKAVALNVILAQSGLFVAGKMHLSPFSQIITRLSGQDNILQGESSFVVEMKELRTILRQSDSKTLVVADELCRGTENISATSLTVPAIQFLVEQNSCFIFSSHNHDLPKILYPPAKNDVENDVRSSTNIRICHLSLRYDSESNSLIYSRKLADGSGDSIYGLEVASSLGLDKKFISKAYQLRKNLINDNYLRSSASEASLFLSTKKSKYNSKVYVDSCFLCGRRNNLQTHHIVEQHEFHPDDGKQKNIPGNLVEMCAECHNYLHTKGFKIVTDTTSNGIKINV